MANSAPGESLAWIWLHSFCVLIWPFLGACMWRERRNKLAGISCYKGTIPSDRALPSCPQRSLITSQVCEKPSQGAMPPPIPMGSNHWGTTPVVRYYDWECVPPSGQSEIKIKTKNIFVLNWEYEEQLYHGGKMIFKKEKANKKPLGAGR